MCSRMLRNVLNVSIKFTDQKILRNTSLIFPILTVRNVPSCTNSYHCIRYYSSEIINERQSKIDEDAQKQIDILIAAKPETKRLIKILELEIDVMKHNGECIPSKVRPRDWLELFQLSDENQRKKYLRFLLIRENKIIKLKRLKVEKNLKIKQIIEERQAATNSGELIYGIERDFTLDHSLRSKINETWNWNSLKALMYGNKLVIDCGYEQYMNSYEISSCAKQILESYSMNRQHNFPFEIFLCNVNLSGPLMNKVHRFIPTLFDNDFPLTVTPKSYLELFEQRELVYLTADSHTVLDKYDPNSIYIVGAFVDKSTRQPISLRKAMKNRLQTAKLPLDKYIRFGASASGKNLILNHVLGIMLDAQYTDWNYALRHVPKRKLYENRMRAMEKRVQRDMLLNDSASSEENNEHRGLFNNDIYKKLSELCLSKFT